MKVKKLGIGKALGTDVFPGSEQEMLDRIQITGFEVDTSTTPPSVVTKFRIINIPSSTPYGPASSAGIANTLSTTTFRANALA